MPPRTPPADCPDMPTLRAQIDTLDAELVALLVERAGYIDRAITLKQASGLPANIASRVEDVVAKVKAEAARSGLDPALAEVLWRSLIDWSIAREERVLGRSGKKEDGNDRDDS